MNEMDKIAIYAGIIMIVLLLLGALALSLC